MIIPCIDLMDGKVVQLVQGRDKIDLDAAMGRGSNDGILALLASRAVIRGGGGVRTVRPPE